MLVRHTQPPGAQTIDQLIRKAGFIGATTSVRSSLRVMRYQSTSSSLTYEEFSTLREHAVGAGGLPIPRKQHRQATVSAAQ